MGWSCLGEPKSDVTCSDRTESSRKKTLRRSRMGWENIIKKNVKQLVGGYSCNFGGGLEGLSPRIQSYPLKLNFICTSIIHYIKYNLINVFFI